MTSKLQQAKDEKLLKELARLPDNKRCAICTNMGTQYTCQPPNIFVCSACAGVLYNFPGLRVKSRSMATYTTQEVQQMKEGGNALFLKHHLAKWDSNILPAPVDNNPKRTEEFIKRVLVDKAFYSEEVMSKGNNKEVLSVKPRAVLSTVGTGSFKKQPALPKTASAESSWEAFSGAKSAEINTSNSGQSTMTGTSGGGGNWAEFPTQPTTKISTNNSVFDPFGTTAPDLTTPISAQPTPPQNQGNLWDPFQDQPVVRNLPQSSPTPVGWSNFETPSIAKDPATVNNGMKTTPESGTFDAQQSTLLISTNDGTKQKSMTPRSPALDPLPEEWFSVGNSTVSSGPFGDPRTGMQGTLSQQQSYMIPTNHQQMQYPVFGVKKDFQNPQTSAFSYGHPNMSPPSTLGSFPSFRTTTGQPPNAQSWNTPSKPYTLQSQDSMQSYVSARVDDSAHHPLFQNLDMDMRAKAHSVAGVPIQTRGGVFRNGGPIPGNSTFARPDATSAEIQYSFLQQQRNFEEASGNPFA